MDCHWISEIKKYDQMGLIRKQKKNNNRNYPYTENEKALNQGIEPQWLVEQFLKGRRGNKKIEQIIAKSLPNFMKKKKKS